MNSYLCGYVRGSFTDQFKVSQCGIEDEFLSGEGGFIEALGLLRDLLREPAHIAQIEAPFSMRGAVRH